MTAPRSPGSHRSRAAKARKDWDGDEEPVASPRYQSPRVAGVPRGLNSDGAEKGSWTYSASWSDIGVSDEVSAPDGEVSVMRMVATPGDGAPGFWKGVVVPAHSSGRA
jgi:hypothetical protein